VLLAACFIAMLQAEGLAAGRQEHRIRRDAFTPMDPSGDGEAFEEGGGGRSEWHCEDTSAS
jgi:hypothetical protein